MAKRGDAAVLRHIVGFLRQRTNLSQAEFGEKSRVTQSDLSDYELGKRAPSEEALRRMAKAADIEWALVAALRRVVAALLDTRARRQSAAFDSAAISEDAALLAVVPARIQGEGFGAGRDRHLLAHGLPPSSAKKIVRTFEGSNVRAYAEPHQGRLAPILSRCGDGGRP